MVSRKSMASGCGSPRISLMVRSHFFQFALVLTASAFFIFPVCGKALFGYIIHPLAAYLHFYPLAFVAHQSYVKCLIAVGFRMAYPVAQRSGCGL